MNIINFLSSDNYIALNRDIIKLFGLNGAVLLCELCSEYRYWESRDELKDGYFYSTIENIEDKTSLTRFQQDKSLKKLKEQGIVDIVIKGMPAKRYIKLNVGTLQIVCFNQTSLRETYNQVCEKLTTNKNIYSKNKEEIYKRKYYIKEKNKTKYSDRNFEGYDDSCISDGKFCEDIVF